MRIREKANRTLVTAHKVCDLAQDTAHRIHKSPKFQEGVAFIKKATPVVKNFAKESVLGLVPTLSILAIGLYTQSQIQPPPPVEPYWKSYSPGANIALTALAGAGLGLVSSVITETSHVFSDKLHREKKEHKFDRKAIMNATLLGLAGGTILPIGLLSKDSFSQLEPIINRADFIKFLFITFGTFAPIVPHLLKYDKPIEDGEKIKIISSAFFRAITLYLLSNEVEQYLTHNIERIVHDNSATNAIIMRGIVLLSTFVSAALTLKYTSKIRIKKRK